MEFLSNDAPLLIAQSGPLNGQRWSITNTIIIGRDQTCDLVIADRQVSRRHARLKPTNDGVLLEDLGSRNGTHLHGNQVKSPRMLEDGDVFYISIVQEFIYLTSDATLPLEGQEFEYATTQSAHMLRLEKRSRRVWIGSEEVQPPLSVSQFRLLQELYENQDQVIPRQKLIEVIWGADQAVIVSEQALDALIRRLRDRLAEIDPVHSFIVTVRGHGLRLDNPLMNNK